MHSIRRSIALTIAAGLLLAATGVSAVVLAKDETEPTLQEQARRLTHENACRRAEAELAEGERFYLVLDTGRRSLSLKLRGALLRELSIDSIEVGRPYRFFFARGTLDEVRGRSYRRSRLAPPRPLLRFTVEIPEDSDEETRTAMLPPEAESAIDVPRRFFLRYDDGVSLEFHAGAVHRALVSRVADAFSAMFSKPELRLRLELDRAEAEAFYRSVPRETDLLVR